MIYNKYIFRKKNFVVLWLCDWCNQKSIFQYTLLQIFPFHLFLVILYFEIVTTKHCKSFNTKIQTIFDKWCMKIAHNLYSFNLRYSIEACILCLYLARQLK